MRKVLADYFLAGSFNEYTGIYIYLSDLFLFATLVAWTISILYNKSINLSINRIKNVPCRTLLILIIPLAVVLWSFVSIKWANNQQIALYRSFKLFEFYLLFLFLTLKSHYSLGNILKNIFEIIIFLGVINALIGIFQFIFQHSVGLFWLKESLISSDLPGVAKIVLDGTKYIRAYGLLPHPNILGGFLLLSIVVTWVYRKLFYLTPTISLPKGGSKGEIINVSRETFIWVILGIQIVGEILTFSKSAILGFILTLIYIFQDSIIPRGTFKRSLKRRVQFEKTSQIGNMGKKQSILKKAPFLLVIIFLAIYLTRPDFGSIFINSLKERLFYLDIAKSIISNNFLTGIGAGQFIIEIPNYSEQTILNWQFQPVHNVFLLILAELGLVGLSIFIWFVWKVFNVEQSLKKAKTECSAWNEARCEVYSKRPSKNVPHGTVEFRINLVRVFKAILIGFFVISLFDHYLWDIQQGQIMLWMVFGLLAGTAD